MAFCSHCGKPTAGERFCAACGAPVASDAVASMAAEMRRNRTEMRLIAIALGLVLTVGAGLVVSNLTHFGQGGQTSTPAQRRLPAIPKTDEQSSSAEAAPRAPFASPQERTSPSVGVSSSERQTASQSARTEETIVPQSRPFAPLNDARRPAENATTEPPTRSQQSKPETPEGTSSGMDRYPGSQPIKVDAVLPDIGVPVATQAYTASDSLSEVVNYYRQRYPDAQVTEANGQTIIAVDRPGGTKVIAVGTTGSETRIAIVQPK